MLFITDFQNIFKMVLIKISSFESIVQEAIKKFNEIFSCEPNLASCAPGRVNLIGEHVDYNDGYVFPMVIIRYFILFLN